MIVLGRRRVGKTALINEFCKDKPVIFFSTLNSTARENLEALLKAIFAFKSPNATSSLVFPDYFAALDGLTALAKQERFVLVIDEYPRLAKAYPAISSMLQHRIDHEWCQALRSGHFSNFFPSDFPSIPCMRISVETASSIQGLTNGS